MTAVATLTFLDTFSGTVSGRVTDYLHGDTVKCETVGCPNDATRVIHWRDGQPGGTLEAVCERDGFKLLHPSRYYLRAVDVTDKLPPVTG